MVDPLEAIIAHLRDNTDLVALVGDRVASRHQFGSGWDVPCKALQLRADGGTPDIYTKRQMLRVEARCYGESPYQAMRVYLALVGATRDIGHRAEVETDGGNAIIYWLNMSSGPSALHSPDIGVSFTLAFLDACVAEEDVP